MNRRDFVKALAGIPLLGLLVKVPEEKEDVLEGAYAELRLGAEKQPPYELNVGKGVLDALRSSGVPSDDDDGGDEEPWYVSAEPVGTVAFADPFWGNSTNDGLSPEAPVATLQKAFEIAAETEGGIIIVRLA